MTETEIKTFGFCAYLGPLWLLGLFGEYKTSRWLRFHLNQGACLFIAEMMAAVLVVGGAALLKLIPVAGDIISAVFAWLFGAAAVGCALYLSVYGMMGVNSGKKRQLPIIGGFSVIEY